MQDDIWIMPLFQPDNILGVTRGGRARLKLADFGTAKLLDEDKVGTFFYI